MGNYIFNGYELPALPERDKTIYPYATIEISGNYGVYAMLRYTKSKQIYDGQYVVPGENREQIYWYIATDSEGTEWQGGNEGELAEDAYSGFVKWSDYDITTTDGTLYLPATAPIPVSTAKTWKYNGVELPALSEVEWDVETYSYAALFDMGEYGYVLYLTSVIPSVDEDSTPISNVNYSAYILSDDAWALVNSEAGANTDIPYRPFWASVNVLNEDGTTYLSLSSPVPVSNVSAAQANFLMGMQLGKIIARNRKPSVPVDPPVTGDVLDNELPIEWNSLAVANNTKAEIDDMPLVKISNLTPTISDFQSFAVAATADGVEITAPCVHAGATGNVIAAVYYNETAGVELVACSVSTAGEDAELGVTFPSTGLYVSDYSQGVPDTSIDFKTVAAVADNRTLFIVSANSVTEDSVAFTIGEEGGEVSPYTMLKVSDIVMTAEQIGASAISMGGESFDTVGDYVAEQNNQYVQIYSGDGYAGFVVLVVYFIMSVSEQAANDGIAPEAGTYVYVPDNGAATYKLALYYSYNGIILPPLPYDWDREKYPYAMIDSITINGMRMCALYLTDLLYIPTGGYNATHKLKAYMFEYGYDTNWKLVNDSEEYSAFTPSPPIWTNTDILNEDGTVYLAASDPVVAT